MGGLNSSNKGPSILTGDNSSMWAGIIVVDDDFIVIDEARPLRSQCPPQLLAIEGDINGVVMFQSLSVNYSYDIPPHT